MSSMFSGQVFERRQRILDFVRAEGKAVVSELSDRFSISPATLRRDLRALEAQHLIARSYGVFYPTDVGGHETAVDDRHKALSQERLAIAEASVSLLSGANTVFLDEGALLEDLVGPLRAVSRLTVVTTSVNIAADLGRRTDHDVIMVGGRLRPGKMGTVDHWAVSMLGQLNVDLAFIGANGVSLERGLTTPDPAVAQTKQAAIAAARQIALVCEHSRFGVTSFARFADIEQLTWIVTGKGLTRASSRRYSARGPRVIRV